MIRHERPVMTVDLYAPLGQRKAVKRRFQFVRASVYLTLGLLVLSLVGFAGWAIVVDDPLGGEPVAIANADVRVQSAVKKPADTQVQTAGVTEVSMSEAAPASAPPGSRMVTIIDGSNGKRQNIIVPEFDERNAAAGDRLIDRSPQDSSAKAGTAPRAAKSTPVKQNIP
jgi:hypothetical protein